MVRKRCIDTCSSEVVYAPFYEKMLCFGNCKKPERLFAGLLLWSLFPHSLLLIAAAAFGCAPQLMSTGLLFFGGPIITAVGLCLLSVSYRDALRAFPAVSELTDERKRKACKSGFQAMFMSRGQIVLCTSLASAGVLTALAARQSLPSGVQQMPTMIWWMFLACVFYVAWLTAPGLWFAGRSLLWARSILRQDDITLSRFFPNRTKGLCELSKLMWKLSFRFTVECTLGMLVLWLIPYHDRGGLIGWWLAFWPFVLLPFILFYFLYPPSLAGQAVKSCSDQVMDDLENHISSLYDGSPEHTEQDVQRIRMYYALHTAIESRATPVPDGRMAGRFIATTLLPVGLYVIQHQQEVTSALRALGRVIR